MHERTGDGSFGPGTHQLGAQQARAREEEEYTREQELIRAMNYSIKLVRALTDLAGLEIPLANVHRMRHDFVTS